MHGDCPFECYLITSLPERFILLTQETRKGGGPFIRARFQASEIGWGGSNIQSSCSRDRRISDFVVPDCRVFSKASASPGSDTVSGLPVVEDSEQSEAFILG